MESTSWKGPDVWRLSWHMTLQFPYMPRLWPFSDQNIQLNSSQKRVSHAPHVVPLQLSASCLCAFTVLGPGNWPNRLCLFLKYIRVYRASGPAVLRGQTLPSGQPVSLQRHVFQALCWSLFIVWNSKALVSKI